MFVVWFVFIQTEKYFQMLAIILKYILEILYLVLVTAL
jgi:hypothetical protein